MPLPTIDAPLLLLRGATALVWAGLHAAVLCAPGPALTVDATADGHTIPPEIYGMNFADEALAKELALPVRRWGGNRTTRYNWRIDVDNSGNDWFFENLPNPLPIDGRTLPDGSAADRFVEQNRRTGTASLISVPMSGWVAKRRPPGDTHPFDCGFQVSRYGAQQQVDPWDTNCGNGRRPDGSLITGNAASDTSMPSDTAFVQDWVRHLVGAYGKAAQGGVRFYGLDNEPELWSATHRDVRPQHLGYDELRDRSIQYAAAIKAVDATAKVIGPSSWGWTAYFYSDLDGAPGGNWWDDPKDRNAHGGVPLAEWYLQQMRAHEQATGQRVLDYLDEHYYPQAGAVTTDAVDPATRALRLRSTRALWDPTYVDESWIGEPVRLLPRMREWVAANYPGTKLSLSEYHWGALNHLNGALAQADVLGIFGRERLDMATLWAMPTATDPGAFAFRMYRNVDGRGGQFGRWGVRATSADASLVSVFAARRGKTGPLTVMVINKSSEARETTLTLSHYTAASQAKGWRYSGANLSAIQKLPATPVSGGTLALTLPAESISFYLVPLAAAR